MVISTYGLDGVRRRDEYPACQAYIPLYGVASLNFTFAFTFTCLSHTLRGNKVNKRFTLSHKTFISRAAR